MSIKTSHKTGLKMWFEAGKEEYEQEENWDRNRKKSKYG